MADVTCLPTVWARKSSTFSPLPLGRSTRSVSAASLPSRSNLAVWLPPMSDRHLHFSQQSQ